MDLTVSTSSYVSPEESNAKLSQHSPAVDDDHDNWSAEGSSAEEAGRSQHGAVKRKRPLSVSCETCKTRKVKCDRGQPSCGWCLKNDSQCVYLPRKKPGLRAGYGRELEARLGESSSVLPCKSCTQEFSRLRIVSRKHESIHWSVAFGAHTFAMCGSSRFLLSLHESFYDVMCSSRTHPGCL